MLPAHYRMRQRAEFTATIRAGRRSGHTLLTVHLLVRPGEREAFPRVGFVVGKAVGTAVVRNKVRRRLRCVMSGYLPLLPPGSLLVVRAHPQTATARQADLAAELELVMGKLLRRQVGMQR